MPLSRSDSLHKASESCSGCGLSFVCRPPQTTQCDAPASKQLKAALLLLCVPLLLFLGVVVGLTAAGWHEAGVFAAAVAAVTLWLYVLRLMMARERRMQA